MKIEKFIYHLAAIGLFILASLIYFNPVLSGKKIHQSDITQYAGMARQVNDFRKETDTEPYWLDNAFVGMPSYQVGVRYPYDFIRKMDAKIRFLPAPAWTLFLYFFSFYVLLLTLKIDWRISILGALAFGFSTYMIIILGVGHNTKAAAIGYMPLVLAGILLCFQKRYWLGFVVTTLSLSLNINANHYQMTYYLLLLGAVLGIVFMLDAIRKRKYTNFLKSTGVLAVAALLSLAINSTPILATKEYVAVSIRGNKTLSINPDGTPKEQTKGLDKEYITAYSYGISESLNLFAARIFGGSSAEALDSDSDAYNVLVNQMEIPANQAKEIIKSLPIYWKDQPLVAAPAYIGAVIVFLFVLALFLVNGKSKHWLVTASVMALLLSWGKNFPALTNFMIDYFPMYNKFRAVSSIQVILELCIPALAMLGLSEFFSTKTSSDKKWHALKWSFVIVGGGALGLLLIKDSFSFSGPNDGYYRDQILGFELMEAIKEDRKTLFTTDVLRSLGLVLGAALLLFLFYKEKLKQNLAILLLGGLLLLDLVPVDWRYVNKDNFVSKKTLENPFLPTQADQQILQDKGHFRVYEPSLGMSNARTAYFHNAIGGYNAARPAAIQELYDFHISKNNLQVLNMLNVKYIIQPDESQQQIALKNPNANGNAWFVDRLLIAKTPNQLIKMLDTINTKKIAIAAQKDTSQPFQVAKKDSTAFINLADYKPNKLTYKTASSTKQLAVFSEMYYQNGWDAYIDGQLSPHFKVDHALRAMYIPKGNHKIEFRFEPKIIKIGSTITLAGYGLFLLLAIGGGYFNFKKHSISS